jgi:hypothetical protein
MKKAKETFLNILNKPTMSIEQLAKKYKVPESVVEKQVEMGIEVEKEHTDKIKVAKEIALDHIGEKLYYYKDLKKAEKG